MSKLCRARNLLTLSVVVMLVGGGCQSVRPTPAAGTEMVDPTGPDEESVNRLSLILPARPRDEVFAAAREMPAAMAELDLEVLRWHSTARWDEVEDRIRQRAGRCSRTVVSIWQGEVRRSVRQPPPQMCWYLVVVIGPVFRPAGPPRPLTTVSSLEYAEPIDFLMAVDAALERFERWMDPNAPHLAGGDDAVSPDGNKIGRPTVIFRRAFFRPVSVSIRT